MPVKISPVKKLENEICKYETKLQLLKDQLKEEQLRGHNFLPAPSVIDELVKNEKNVISIHFDEPALKSETLERPKTARGRPRKNKNE
jgi:hypothetical protein